MIIRRIYFDTSMQLGFIGLRETLLKSKVKIEESPPSDAYVFVNRRRAAFKILLSGSTLVYHNTYGRPFPLDAIKNIPDFFDGTRINFSAAVEKAVREKHRGDGWILESRS
jgi:hypothetical protein